MFSPSQLAWLPPSPPRALWPATLKAATFVIKSSTRMGSRCMDLYHVSVNSNLPHWFRQRQGDEERQLKWLRDDLVVVPTALVFEYKRFWIGMAAEWETPAVSKDVSLRCSCVYFSYDNSFGEILCWEGKEWKGRGKWEWRVCVHSAELMEPSFWDNSIYWRVCPR